MHVVGLHQRDF